MAQPLTDWGGDVDSLLTEMKRRAGVNTDTELARIIGTSQSNVSTWRKRGAVPQSVLLKFERMNLSHDADPVHRTTAATMIAMRVAEFAFERSASKSRTVFYMTVAGAWNLIVKTIIADLEKKEARTRRWPSDLAVELIEDAGYLAGLADWVMSLTIQDALASIRDATLPQ